MPDYHDSIPISLINAGFDVWLDGNRGTLYQRETTPEQLEEAEFWDFTAMDMGMYDQPAQIEYILEQTGKESLSFWGYSMGTMQIMYAIGVAQEDDALWATLQKIDKALLLTPCLNSGLIEGTLVDRRVAGAGAVAMYEAVDKLMLWGEGADKESDLEFLCQFN
jgi:lysosomal acid lipase/cholesteryl ester hydrolase